ncbi:MAG: hypothetical protein RLZZ58_1593 [Pseudomonadota bacterium]
MPATGLFQRLHARYLDVLASVYIYNEYRGYTSLDRVLRAVRARCADDIAFIAQVEKHRADERKHYLMFKRYYELSGRMPLRVGRACGHIDHFIETMFGCTIDDLDTDAVIANADLFEKLCRVIMLTEQRGVTQVDVLLAHPLVKRDKRLVRIFEVIRKDEPDHWQPYHRWLVAQQRVTAHWRERATDFWIHKSLMLVKLPLIFVRRSTPRLTHWPDADDGALQSAA